MIRAGFSVRKARAASLAVAPLVITSSTKTTVLPARPFTWRAANAPRTFSRRCAMVLAVCRGVARVRRRADGRIVPREALFLHSDGLSESRSAAGEEFGDARIEALIRQFAAYGPQEAADAIFGSLRSFRGRVLPDDDVSVAIIRRT